MLLLALLTVDVSRSCWLTADLLMQMRTRMLISTALSKAGDPISVYFIALSDLKDMADQDYPNR